MAAFYACSLCVVVSMYLIVRVDSPESRLMMCTMQACDHGYHMKGLYYDSHSLCETC